MRSKIIIAIVSICLITNIRAQTIVAGKKIETTTSITQNITSNVDGTDFTVDVTYDLYHQFEVRSANNSSITINGIFKRLKGGVTMMGADQNFDSNDSTMANNPQMGNALKELNLNKGEDISLSRDKLNLFDVATFTNAGAKDIATNLFLPVTASSWKENTTWTDSSISERGKTINTYIVTKIAGDEITLTVTSITNITATAQQMGMETKTTSEIRSTANYIYSKSSGILKSETQNSTSTGTVEAAGQSIATHSSITVNIAVN